MRRIVAGIAVFMMTGGWAWSARAESKEVKSKVDLIWAETKAKNNRIVVEFVEKTGCNGQGKPDPNGDSVLLQYGNAETKYMMAILQMAKAAGKKVVFWIDTATCELKNLSPLD